MECRQCGHKKNRLGHDWCIGTLPGIMAACCGHNNPNKEQKDIPYFLFKNGTYVRVIDGTFIVSKYVKFNDKVLKGRAEMALDKIAHKLVKYPYHTHRCAHQKYLGWYKKIKKKYFGGK